MDSSASAPAVASSGSHQTLSPSLDIISCPGSLSNPASSHVRPSLCSLCLPASFSPPSTESICRNHRLRIQPPPPTASVGIIHTRQLSAHHDLLSNAISQTEKEMSLPHRRDSGTDPHVALAPAELRLFDWHRPLRLPGELAEPGSYLHKASQISSLPLLYLKGKAACDPQTG